jgi:hypothetical protein
VAHVREDERLIFFCSGGLFEKRQVTHCKRDVVLSGSGNQDYVMVHMKKCVVERTF